MKNFFLFTSLISFFLILNIVTFTDFFKVTEVLAVMAGSGTTGDPYQITSWTELNQIRNSTGSHYKLMNDLTSEDVDYSGIGDDWNPTGLSGSFDGQGYTISGLNINKPASNHVGLFGAITADISNINLIVGDVIGNNRVAAFVAYNHGRIINSHVIVLGDISGNSQVGGFVGQIEETGLITDSSIIIENGATVTGNGVGAFVGDNYLGSVINSHAIVRGTISGTSNVGALEGIHNGTTTNSYVTIESSGTISSDTTSAGALIGTAWGGSVSSSSAIIYSGGTVSGDSYVGGLIGDYGSVIITDSYATVEGTVSGNTYVGGLIGKRSGGSISDSFVIIKNSATIAATISDVGLVIGSDVDGIDDNLLGTIQDNTHGEIAFSDWNVLATEGGNLLDYINISNNLASVDSSLNPGLNKPAEITLKNLTFNQPIILRDGTVCEGCTIVSYSGGDIVFTVLGFSNYTAAEKPIKKPSTSAQGQVQNLIDIGHFETVEKIIKEMPYLFEETEEIRIKTLRVQLRDLIEQTIDKLQNLLALFQKELQRRN